MPKKPGAYSRPHELPEALDLLSRPNSVILAGGTKLLASEAGLDADQVVDLQALALDKVDYMDGELTVGATCTLSAFAATLVTLFPGDAAAALLTTAVRRAGPNTYRNAATVGGSIAARLPDSELLAALLLFEARLQIVSRAGTADMDLALYLAAEERPQGLITAVEFAWPEGEGATERVARTPADYPIVSITAWRTPDGKARLAATGLGLVPQRLARAEATLSSGLATDTIESAASATGDATTHPGDFRGDASYRAEMARVLTRRVLRQLGG
jgi:CO/xanthine dehydrogenase FAD-binding subunit